MKWANTDPYHYTMVTFSIAQDAPIGVVCVAFTSRLSRLYTWSLLDDTFQPGQFLKARAYVQSISKDGRYFGYRAEAQHKIDQSYVAIARPGYFTALGFFPHPIFHWDQPERIDFLTNGDIRVLSHREEIPYIVGYEQIQERITPGCPVTIHREATNHQTISSYEDSHQDRKIWSKKNVIYSQKGVFSKPQVIGEFAKEPFEAIEPPEWAMRW